MASDPDFESILIGTDDDDPFSQYRGWSFWLYESPYEFTPISQDLMARTAKTVGGGEGEGEYVCVVVEVMQLSCQHDNEWKTNRFFEKLGFYTSYDGVDMDGTFSEVFPKQKTITVYE